MPQPTAPDHDQRLKVLLKQYATGENLLGVALSALMRQPAERRAELYAKGLKRIAGSGENDYRRFLLAECFEAYAELDEAQKERVQALLHTEAYREVEPLMKTAYERGKAEAHREVEPLMKTTYERGIEQGKAEAHREVEPLMKTTYERGIEDGVEQDERRAALRLMEKKFGPLSAEVKRRVEALSPEAVARLQLDLLDAQTVEELRLDD